MDKKVLIVDDVMLNREMLAEILETNYSVEKAKNGREALDLIEASPASFSLIMLDLIMPVMDGLAAAKIINDEGIAPVLLLTAYSQQDIVDKAKEAGVFAYLVKPVREEQLFPAMEIAASRFAEVQELSAELDNLKESLETRKLLDRAKGILMTAHGMTEQEAYRKMQQFSMAKRISLKELAESIIKAANKK